MTIMRRNAQAEAFKINPFVVTFTPLAGSTFSNLMRMLGQNRFRVNAIGMPRMLYSLTMSAVLSPLNVYEKLRYNKRIDKFNIGMPPIFIVGHWRSGTTFLHNLITQDPQFSYATTFQTVTPGVFLSSEKIVKPLVAASLPPTRPQDDLELGADLPQEEEYGIGNLSPFSFYNGWCFPRNMEFYYRYVCLDNVSPAVVNEWKQCYLRYIKKLSYYHADKRLVLKNPANTARIKLLLEMFPNSQFIHIYRNPYHNFLSMKRNIEKEMTLYCVQRPKDPHTVENLMVNLYNTMHVKYFKEKEFIPEGNLVEVRFEDLAANPLDVIKRIYKALDISGFKELKEKLTQYIASQTHIKAQTYTLSPTLKEKIYCYYKYTIDKWGYEP